MVDFKSVFPQDLKKSVILGVGILTAVVLIVVAIGYVINESSYVYYKDKFYKLQIKYPRIWKVMPDYGGTVVTFIAPKDNELDNFAENLNISVSELPSHITSLEQFSTIATGQMDAVFEKNIEVIESKEIDFNGFQAYRYIIQTTQDPILRLQFIWFFKDNKSYILTTISQDFLYKKYSKIFNRMLRSFSFEAQ